MSLVIYLKDPSGEYDVAIRDWYVTLGQTVLACITLSNGMFILAVGRTMEPKSKMRRRYEFSSPPPTAA